MTRLAGSRRSVLVALSALAVLSASLFSVVRAAPAHAELAGPYPKATVFRPDGVLASAPATVSMSDIGLAAFVLGTDAGVWWATPDTKWASLGQPTLGTIQTPVGVIGTPAVVSWGPGRIDLFVEGGDHKLWQRFTTCSGCSWSPWIQPVGSDGVLASPPAVTSWAPGRIDVLVQGTDHNIWQRDWDTDSWSGSWLNIGSPPEASQSIAGQPPTITTFGPGRLDIFIEGADQRLWQTFFANDTWQGWFQPPGTAGGLLNSAPAADWWNDGGGKSLTVFVQGVDNHLYETTYAGTAWSAWTIEGALGNVFQGQPQVETTFQFFQPTVLVWGTDNRCYYFLPGATLTAARSSSAVQFSASRAGFSSFTMIDTLTGAVYSSPGSDTQVRTASVIKVPIAMTLIRNAASQNRPLTSAENANLRSMITRSDNNAATALWNEVGGSAAVLGMMRQLGATNTAPYGPDPQAWGFTLSTSHDLATVLARLAEGVYPGSATIVNLMHQVIPSQSWGIAAALPGSAIKNGWFPDPGDWRVNCLGIIDGTRYALAVMTKYPAALGQVYGERTCQGIAADLFPPVPAAQLAAAQPAAAQPAAAQPADATTGGVAPAAGNAAPAIIGTGMTADGG